jgi:hypothetical protein
MAVNALNSTTLSEAVFVGQDPSVSFTVASTANIAVGSLLAVCGTGGFEMMKVQEIPISGRVNVLRGVGGTVARKHASGTLVYIGTPELFKEIRDTQAALVGDNNGFPDYLLPGSRARDGAGNEYVMVDLTMTAVALATVLISKDGLFTASVITGTSVGSVGVLMESGTSTQWAWAQIYGFVAHAKLVGGSSLVSSLGEFGGATSVSTPSVGLLGRSSSQRSSDYLVGSTINGMFPASAASTASTSASSETGLFCAAWLQYPYIERAITS